jgi:multiple sugar transport system permease protein
MAQHEMSVAPPVASVAAAERAPRRAEDLGLDSPLVKRYWGPRIGAVMALLLGGAFAYGLPAVTLADDSTLGLDEISQDLALKGSGWVVALGWFAVIVGVVAALVFPRAERFIQTIAVSVASVVAMVVPYYVATHLSKVNEEATDLGVGLILAWVCFAVAAVLPWLSLLVWDRSRPVLGRDWAKWVFVLPAVIWVFAMTLFPLVYALTTSRYAFRNGRINRFVGWDNYRRLFETESWAAAVGWAVVWAVVAAAVVMAVGLGWTFLVDRRVTDADVRRIAAFVPIAAVPAALIYLTRTVLADPLGEQLWITFIFVAGAVGTEMVLGFLVALFMNRELRGRGVLRAIMTLPIFGTPIALGYLARAFFYEEGGPINYNLELIGISGPPWLSDPNWAKVATIIVDVWQWTPFVFIIALAGLQGLPQDVIEASEVDGAGPFQNLRHIILPLMAPILWLIFLLRAIDAFKVFDIAQGLTLGGPGRATEYYSLFNYRTARQFFNYGDAAAQAFLLLFVVMVLVSLLWGRIRHIYEDEGVQA